MDDDSTRPAGWYYDDDSPTIKKFWDGEKWTGQVAPRVQPATPKTVGVLTIARGVALGLIATLAAVWFVYGLVTANDDLECSIDSANRAVDGLPAPDCD